MGQVMCIKSNQRDEDIKKKKNNGPIKHRAAENNRVSESEM